MGDPLLHCVFVLFQMENVPRLRGHEMLVLNTMVILGKSRIPPSPFLQGVGRWMTKGGWGGGAGVGGGGGGGGGGGKGEGG